MLGLGRLEAAVGSWQLVCVHCGWRSGTVVGEVSVAEMDMASFVVRTSFLLES